MNFVFVRLLVFCLIFFSVLEQNAQNWLWAKITNGNGHQNPHGCSSDGAGNTFITGWYNGSNMTIGATTLTNNGTSNIFLAKYNSNGNVLWAKNIGGSGFDYGYSVRADSAGNVIIAGMFTSSVIIIGTTTLTNSGSRDILIAKFDGNGNFIWAKAIGGSAWDEARGVTTDSNDNIFLTGQFSSTSINFGNGIITNNGGNMFLVKFNSAGAFQWVRRTGGSTDNIGNSVSCDLNGNAFVTGTFYGNQIYFGNSVILNQNGNNGEIFLAKYDNSGNLLWVKNAGGNMYEWGASVAADRFGNTYITGAFTSSVIAFDSFSLTLNPGNTLLDIFIAKYDAFGNVLWAKSGNGSHYDEGYSVSTDISGNVFVTGGFSSPSITIDNQSLINTNYETDFALFILKLSPAGQIQCASMLQSGGYRNDVSVDPNGNAAVTGINWNYTLIIGSDTLQQQYNSAFLTKYYCRTVVTSTDDNKLLNQVKVYPVPYSGIFTIESEKSELGNIKIYDLMKRCVYKNECNSSRLEIDLSSQPSGVYLAEIEHDQEKATFKIIR